MTTEEIMAKYPILFQGSNKSPRECLMCFGFECGEGWFPIIDELSAKIEAWNKEHSDTPIIAMQVKEKFGGLRFYLNGTTDEVDKWVTEAEDKAWKTCDRCGSTEDVIHTSGWIQTICRKCSTRGIKDEN